MLFGGRAADGSDLDDLWRMSSGGGWTLVTTAHQPPARANACMVYDSGSDRLVLFGGSAEGGATPYNDVWSLSLAGTPDWIELAPNGSIPGVRDGATMVYDPAQQRALMFGGYNGAGLTSYSDTWQLALSADPPTWTRLLAFSPAGTRRNHTAVLDPVGNRMIVFGGSGAAGRRNDTWALSLSGTPKWSVLSPAGQLPEPREGTAGAYDPMRQRMLMFGGSGSNGWLGDSWALSLRYDPAWIRLAPVGTSPEVRGWCPGTFAAADGQFVVFGGLNAAYLSDTWRMSSADDVLDLAAQPFEGGTIAQSPEGRCFDPATEVTLTATPAAGFKFTSWEGDLTGKTNPATVTMDGYKVIVAHFDPIAVATLIVSFDATAGEGGVELRWKFADPSQVRAVNVERAIEANGPWVAAVVHIYDGNGESMAIDRATESGRDCFYRLRVTLGSGEESLFGPVRARAASAGRSAIVALAPNPSPNSTRVDFTVVRRGPVRLEVLDIGGRVVAVLADGVHEGGRHQATWQGNRAGSRVAAGLYFVRLIAPEATIVRRLAITR